MAALIQQLSCRLKTPKMSSQKGTTPLSCGGPRDSGEMPIPIILTLPPKRGNCTYKITSKSYQISQRNFDNTAQKKRHIHESVSQPNSTSSRDGRREKKKKRRSNRESIFSFMSIVSKSDDGRLVEATDTGIKDEISSPVYSQFSFLSSSSTIDIPQQVQSQKSNTSPVVLAPGHISMTQSRSSLPWHHRVSGSRQQSFHQEDSPKFTSQQLGNDQYQSNLKKDDEDMGDEDMGSSVSEQDMHHPNFFQEQQEQEYRIAKAWLDAEESKKTSDSTSKVGIRSGSAEFLKDNPCVKFSNPENIQLIKSTTLKGNHDYEVMSNSCFKSKTIFDKIGVDVPYVEAITAQYSTSAKIFSEENENNVKKKRISGMTNLAIGVRGWLSRRVRSN